MKTHNKLLTALVAGILCGTLAHYKLQTDLMSLINTHVLQSIGQIFLRLIFMVVVPMIFCALVLGVFELGKEHGVGRVALKTLGYTVVASTIAVLLGIGLVNLVKPGVGFNLQSEALSSVEAIKKNVTQAKPISQTIVELVPKNPIDAAVRAFDGEIMALMFFALFFGFALSRLPKSGESTLIKVIDQIFNACLKIVDIVMKMGPLAVFCIIFGTAYKYGPEVFKSLFWYVAVVLIGLLIQQLIVYPIILKFVAKRNPWEFFKNSREVLVYAFSTASSNATLPRALELAETTLKLPPKISRFVLTVGSTMNQNGTALFEGVTVLFLAQVYSIDLTFGAQVQVVLMSILAGIGTAGVPGGSLPLIMILLQSVGIPPEGLGLILGVDRFLDMCRTTLNVSGDLVIAAAVSK